MKSWITTKIVLLVVLIIIAIPHLLYLTSIPRGLYFDELGNGYNALSILHSGEDEHEEFLPIYFKSFGDYKHPVYIYTMVAIFTLFGYSEFSIRLTSVFFFFVLLGALYTFSKQIAPKQPFVTLYTLLMSSFLPWFFPFSRIAFAAISQVAIIMWAIVALRKTYYQPLTKHQQWIMPTTAGILLGLSIYTYSTSRLLTFIIVALWLVTHLHKSYLKKNIILTATFGLCLAPYTLFSLQNPGALTARFSHIAPTIADKNKSLIEKSKVITPNYFAHFKPNFLLIRGEDNLRMSTHSTGQIFITTAILTLIGAIVMIMKIIKSGSNFLSFILLATLASPTASSLTQFEVPHATRSLLLGLFIVIISIYGFKIIATRPANRAINKIAICAGIILVLLLESGLYLHDYFTTYPNATIGWFQGYKFKETLQAAVDFNPKQVVVTNNNAGGAMQPYIQLLAYEPMIKNPDNIPLTLGPLLPKPNTCLLYYPHETVPQPEQQLKTHTITIPDSFMQLICYEAVRNSDTK